MPELPEVERHARLVRPHAIGQKVAAVHVHHPAYARVLSSETADALVGHEIREVSRRGKYQLLELDDGSALEVHFRMTGGWQIGRVDDPPVRFARFELDLGDGTRVTLADARALGSVRLRPAGALATPDLGPDPLTPAFTASYLHQALRRRQAPIKPVLLDQRIVAGIGNIYAAESLWLARIDPRRRASTLSVADCARLVRGIRHALRRAPASRYADWTDDDRYRWRVYDREGQRCRRCGGRIVRITQAGRSTYFCRGCQTRRSTDRL